MKNLLFLLYSIAFIAMIVLSTPNKNTHNLNSDLSELKDSTGKPSSNKTKLVSNTMKTKF